MKNFKFALLGYVGSDAQSTQEHEKSPSPRPSGIFCSWNDFKQRVHLTEVKHFNNLRWSLQAINQWPSLCRNLNMNEAVVDRIMNERHTEQTKKDECLKSYLNSNKAYWEEVIVAVARPPFSNKQLAETIAKEHLKHSPNKDMILNMINSCDTITQ